MDVDSLPPGVDFVRIIEESVGSCDVFVAVIGKNWLFASDEEGRRRLDNPDDFVRLELAFALRRNIGVIPVLVDGASMPAPRDLPDDIRPLLRWNALDVSHNRFGVDSQRLLSAVDRVLQKAATERREREEKERLEAQRLEQERLEAQRLEKKRLEAEARERKEKERLEARPLEKELGTVGVEAAVEAAQSAAPEKGARLLSLALLGVLALMWIVLAVSTRSFWTYNNITNLTRQGAMISILAIGETFVMITAGIDLSVGALVGVASVVIASLLANGFPIWAAVAITLVFGLLVGVLHAFVITRLGLPPFIMTLATLTGLRGVGLLITNGATISITNVEFTGFSRGDFLGVPYLFWMLVVIAIPAYLFLHRSRFGRYLFAIGSNREAARLSGVDTTRMLYIAYILCAVCAAFVGILIAARIGIGNATQAEGWELQAIASSAIGGTSLFGAVGSIHGPLLGSFILTTINNGANLLNVNAFWQRIITGLLIIVMVCFDRLRRKNVKILGSIS